MIQNYDDMPPAVRRDLFGIDWLTKAELRRIVVIFAQAIEKLDISKVELSRASNVSDGSVYSLFAGRPIGQKTVRQMSSAIPTEFMVEIDEILNDVGKTHTLIEYSGRTWELSLISKGGG